MISKLLSLIILGLSVQGKQEASAAISFSATVIPSNQLKLERMGDILIARGSAFGVEYHEAFMLVGNSITVALDSDGLHAGPANIALAIKD